MQLTNFAVDEKVWHMYLIIRNLPASIRDYTSSLGLLPVALLPIVPPNKVTKHRKGTTMEYRMY